MQFLSGIKGTLMGKQKPSLGLALLINVLNSFIALRGGILLATFDIDIPKPAVDV